MFGLLKKKISDFVSGLTKREEKEEAPAAQPPPAEKDGEKPSEPAQPISPDDEKIDVRDIETPIEEYDKQAAKIEQIPEMEEKPERKKQIPEIGATPERKESPRTAQPEEEIHQAHSSVESIPEMETKPYAPKKARPEEEIREINIPPKKIATRQEEEEVSQALSRIEHITPAAAQNAAEEKPIENVGFARQVQKEKKQQPLLQKKAATPLQQAMKEIEPKPEGEARKEKPAEIKPMFQPSAQEPAKEEKKGVFSIISDIVHIGGHEKKQEANESQQPRAGQKIISPQSFAQPAKKPQMPQTLAQPQQPSLEKPQMQKQPQPAEETPLQTPSSETMPSIEHSAAPSSDIPEKDPSRPQPQEKPKQSFSIPFITPRKEERKIVSPSGDSSRGHSGRSMEVKVGIGSAIKSIFTGEVEIREGDVSDLLSELELAMLESDVAYDVSIAISSELKTKLVGMKVRRGDVQHATKSAIKEVIISVLTSDRQFDFVSRVKELSKPASILFIGPNGAGKTTTMAKIAKMLMNSGMTVIFSASDTFRAAAIEQTEIHGTKLGVRVIKNAYGSDPASVAFDAIAYARAHNVDAVLIDSAGRQDTNVNLLDELKKINRVAKPALKIYIGESIAGNAIIDQIKAFDAAVGIDGVILTKLDCDAKGGTALSVTRTTGIPILFLGTGQGYADLMPFSPGFVAEEILT